MTGADEARDGQAMDSGAISVMVVDDHPLWRDGVARDLSERGFSVLATAGDTNSAVRIATTVRPDVVLMDLNLGTGSGVDAILRITGDLPATRVLVLSASGAHSDVLEAVKAGASGYLVKSASVEELVDAVQRTAAGDAVFTAGLAGLVLGEYRRMSVSGPEDEQAPQLTDRETDVLRLVAKGLTARQIADRLVISHRTVESHVQSTLRKLQLHNRVELARYAIEHGLDAGQLARFQPNRSAALAAARAATGSPVASAARAAMPQASKVTSASVAPTRVIAGAFIDRLDTPRSGQHAGQQRIGGGLTAHPGRLVRGAGGLGDQGDQPQQRGLPRVVERGDRADLPVRREHVLRQVVGAEADEVDLGEDLLGGQRGGGDLDHHARAAQSGGVRALGEPGGFLRGGHHRRHHAHLGAGVLRGTRDRFELAVDQLDPVARDAQAAHAQRRVGFGFLVQERQRLVRTRVERTDDHWFPVKRRQHLGVCLALRLDARLLGRGEVAELGAEQADAFGAAAPRPPCASAALPTLASTLTR